MENSTLLNMRRYNYDGYSLYSIAVDKGSKGQSSFRRHVPVLVLFLAIVMVNSLEFRA